VSTAADLSVGVHGTAIYVAYLEGEVQAGLLDHDVVLGVLGQQDHVRGQQAGGVVVARQQEVRHQLHRRVHLLELRVESHHALVHLNGGHLVCLQDAERPVGHIEGASVLADLAAGLDALHQVLHVHRHLSFPCIL
jgi:hypothetical protein